MGKTDTADDLDNAIFEIMRSEQVPAELQRRLAPKLKLLVIHRAGEAQARITPEMVRRELKQLKLVR